jgi:DNA-binding transcriptional ArsR family regulator
MPSPKVCPVNITDDRALAHIADYFRALSEPLRLKIVNLLRNRVYNVGELTELLGCSQANVSKHLAILARAGFVSRINQGTSNYYQIADQNIYTLCDLVCGRLGEHFAQQGETQALFTTPKATRTPRKRDAGAARRQKP